MFFWEVIHVLEYIDSFIHSRKTGFWKYSKFSSLTHTHTHTHCPCICLFCCYDQELHTWFYLSSWYQESHYFICGTCRHMVEVQLEVAFATDVNRPGMNPRTTARFFSGYVSSEIHYDHLLARHRVWLFNSLAILWSLYIMFLFVLPDIDLILFPDILMYNCILRWTDPFEHWCYQGLPDLHKTRKKTQIAKSSHRCYTGSPSMSESGPCKNKRYSGREWWNKQ